MIKCVSKSYYIRTVRNRPPEVFIQTVVLKICSKFTGAHPYRSVISIKLQSNFIHKTRNTGMGDGMQGTRGMFTRIPGNALILAFRGMFEKIQGNVINDSKKCSRRFRGMLLKIPGNAREDSGE